MKISAFFLGALCAVLCFGTLAFARQEPGTGAVQYGQIPPQAQVAPADQMVPPILILPAGTLITVRTTQPLSSDRNQKGDGFASVLEQPIVSQGWVVARRGQTAMGKVADAKKAGRVSGVSELSLELSELVLVDGRQLPVRTELVQSVAATSHGQDAAAVGTVSGIGAIIGAAAGGGEGAAIGAAAGAAAGVVGVLSTRGRATEVPPESVLTFRLVDQLAVDTEQSRQAFQTVTAADYPQAQPERPAQPYTPRYYTRPRGAYYPPTPYYGFYSRPYVGFYGIYGFRTGPRVYIAPRIYTAPRFYGRGGGPRRR